jgi:serine/threonine protein phosphatase PrpC
MTVFKASSAPGLRLRACGVTDVGRQREHNEDSCSMVVDRGLFVVADGMGGHQAGDVASKLATQLISEFFENMSPDEQTWPSHFDRTLSEEENSLLTGIHLANRTIFERSSNNRALHGMGTTVVTALFSDKRHVAYFGHVGDSRAYRVRAGGIEQLTRDHSLQNEPFPNMTDAERAELPRNVITRALGMDGHVAVDIVSSNVLVGDAFLLCSDGLSSMVDDDSMLATILSTNDLETACNELIRSANEAGGEDNITAVLIRVDLAQNALEEASTLEMGPETLKRLGRSG